MNNESVFFQAFEDIYNPFYPVRQAILYYANIAFCILFTIEMLMKWFAYGFKKYFSNFWTVLDFFIVVVSFSNCRGKVSHQWFN